MSVVIRRVSLGTTIEAALAITVFLFACGSSSLTDATRVGHSTRWIALFLVCGLALAAAWRAAGRGGMPWRALRFTWLPAAFLGIALLSATWSARPRLTFDRAFSLGVLFVSATALAIAARADLDLRRRVLAGLALGASFVAFAGLLMLVLGMPEARQAAGLGTPWRFKGFGQNPNTIAVLAAVALPVIAWLALTKTSRRARAGWVLSFLVLLGTTVATQSRGGLIAAFVGTAPVLAVLVEQAPRKAAAIAALAGVMASGVILREATTVGPPPFTSAVQPGVPSSGGPGSGGKGSDGKGSDGKGSDGKGSGHGGTTTTTTTTTTTPVTTTPVDPLVPTELPARTDEVGNPGLSTHQVSQAGSGRIAAWQGALDEIRSRPLLGYGFGTEEVVFVDRWYFFQGARTENSVLGLLLQVGVLGLLPLLALLGLLLHGGVRALRSRDELVRVHTVPLLGVLCAAVVLVFIQSYVYSVGNVATVTVWIALFMLGIGVGGRERDAQQTE